MSAAGEEDEAEVAQNACQGLAHSSRRMRVMIAVERHDRAANGPPERDQVPPPSEFLGLPPHVAPMANRSA